MTFGEAIRRVRAFLPAGSLPAVITRTSGAGLVFLAAVVWARALGPHEYGAYALAIAYLSLGASLSGLGLDALTSRELAVLIHRKDWTHFRGYVRWASVVSAVAAALAGVAGAAIMVWNPMGWRPEAQTAALWITLGLPAAVFLRLARGMFQAADRTPKGLFWELTFFNLALSLAGLAAWLSMGEPTARDAALIHVATLLVAAGLALLAFNLLRWPRASVASQQHGHWMSAGLGFAFLAAVSLLLQQADVMLLGAIGTNAEAGTYSVASRCAALVLLVLGPVAQVLGPRIAKAWSSGDAVRAAAIARRAAQLGLVAGAGLLAFCLLFGRLLLHLFGPGYEVAVEPLRILALAHLMILVLGPGQLVLSMTGGERIAGLLVLAALIVGLPLSYLFYKWDGIEGMAWGRVVTLALAGGAAGLLGRHRIGHRIDPWTSSSSGRSPPAPR